jgi:XTP/dITP diphosphohydrolase
MTVFVLATSNAHKVEEIRAVLAPLGVEVRDRPRGVPDVDETESTLEGNALLKARALVEATGEAAIADDTGLFVEALDGRPGVRSARFAGEEATDAENVAKLLAELEGIAPESRGAEFRTVIAVAYPDGRALTVLGSLGGVIAPAPRGEHGFGYDPVFTPRFADGRTLAEMDAPEKNAISHRANALRALAEALGKD